MISSNDPAPVTVTALESAADDEHSMPPDESTRPPAVTLSVPDPAEPPNRFAPAPDGRSTDAAPSTVSVPTELAPSPQLSVVPVISSPEVILNWAVFPGNAAIENTEVTVCGTVDDHRTLPDRYCSILVVAASPLHAMFANPGNVRSSSSPAPGTPFGDHAVA